MRQQYPIEAEQQFGFLTVLNRATRPGNTTQKCIFWRCICVCSAIIVVRSTALRSGHTTSCGCKGIDRTPQDNNDGSFSIPMPCGNKVIVDAADLDKVSKFKWRLIHPSSGTHLTSYAITGVDNNRVMMHRMLTNYPNATDHIDGNGLNNRRSNLRPATPRQNIANTRKRKSKTSSVYKGVCWSSQHGKWRTTVAGKHIGLFAQEIDAARAYDNAAIIIFGEYAKINDYSSNR